MEVQPAGTGAKEEVQMKSSARLGASLSCYYDLVPRHRCVAVLLLSRFSRSIQIFGQNREQQRSNSSLLFFLLFLHLVAIFSTFHLVRNNYPKD